MSKKKNGNGSDHLIEAKRIEPTREKMFGLFGLKQHLGGPLLDEWLSATDTLLPWESGLLDDIYRQSITRIRGWNEEELKMKLVSRVFILANLEVDGKIATFFERPLSATLGEHKLSVVADCLVASPFGETAPDAPYFFLQEYKKSRSEDDPEGQMLAAMLIAQTLNPEKWPVYGAWVQGSSWVFGILDGRDYFFSEPIDTLIRGNLYRIVFIMRELKPLILKR